MKPNADPKIFLADYLGHCIIATEKKLKNDDLCDKKHLLDLVKQCRQAVEYAYGFRESLIFPNIDND